MQTKRYLQTGDAAKYVGISAAMLRYYHSTGEFIPELTLESGHRRYSIEQLDEFIKSRNSQS